MNDETRDERLRRLLREADPAAGDTGLSVDEIREMRRTVLTALPERRRRLVPALALATVATMAVILVAVFIPRPVAKKPSQRPRIAAVPALPAPPRTVQAPPREEPGPTPRIKRPAAQRRRQPPPAMPESVLPEPAAMLAEAEPPAGSIALQQIQFSTPGGTRIIWVLSPGNASR